MSWAGPGASGKILKVLPHFVDAKGRVSLSPSLLERDAYQDYLRKNPGSQSGMRFDVWWSAKRSVAERFELRIEIRSSRGDPLKPTVLTRVVKPPRWWRRWTSVRWDGKPFAEAGKVLAWRASLWGDGQQLAEQQSFLW